MGQRLNLEEIGRMAGVSRSTVSRVVNGEPNVSNSAAKRVKAAIAETGYRPHAAARSLASNRTGVLGLVIPSAVATLFDDPYFGRLILGASGETNALDATLALFLFEQDNDENSIISRVVNPGLVDGVIVTATTMGDPVIEHLRQANMPFVVVGRPDDGSASYSVDADNRGGAKIAAKHLVSCGRTRIGIITPPSNTTAGLDRRLGFLEGLEEAGIDAGGRIEEGNWTEASGAAALMRLLESGVDGVFAGSDRMAVGALNAIRAAGLRCPEDVALVSFDGLVPAGQTSPQLTSIVQPINEVGQRAARLLKSVIDGEITTSEHVVFPTTLAIAESCGFKAMT
ncbi:MAG: LacI family DNA-binding transcriptional regulator [Acidimicrobiia bacterium]|nr:LacI family DNA-binding transcriptional regulator [Acidimicrobiia bacterium]